MITEEKLEKLKKLADAMYYAAQQLTTDASRLHKAMDEYHQFTIHEWREEPVSEDFEGVVIEECSKLLKGETVIIDGYEYVVLSDAEECFKAGANWQKEQLLAKAVDGDITFDYYGDDDKTYGCIAHDSFCLEDFGLKDMDKVKVIVIKEE